MKKLLYWISLLVLLMLMTKMCQSDKAPCSDAYDKEECYETIEDGAWYGQ